MSVPPHVLLWICLIVVCPIREVRGFSSGPVRRFRANRNCKIPTLPSPVLTRPPRIHRLFGQNGIAKAPNPPCQHHRSRGLNGLASAPIANTTTTGATTTTATTPSSNFFRGRTRTSTRQPSIWKRTAVGLVLVAVLSLLLKSQPSWASAAEMATRTTTTASGNMIDRAASQAAPQAMPIVGLLELGIAAVLFYGTGVLTLQFQGLTTLASSLAKACGRCAAQLYLSGSLILTPLLATKQPWIVGAWLTLTGVLAAKEAASRMQYTYPKLQRHLLLSILTSVTLVLTATMVLRIVAPQPWYSPRTWIPISGMLFGNAVTATALAAGTITRELATKKDQLELQLARGATCREAMATVLQTTYVAALTPTMNALSVTGIVHIPGMMTGQLLAGSSPRLAASYQVMIFFLIAATVAASVQGLTQLTIHSMVDAKDDRLIIADEHGQSLLQPVNKKNKSNSKVWNWSSFQTLLANKFLVKANAKSKQSTTYVVVKSNDDAVDGIEVPSYAGETGSTIGSSSHYVQSASPFSGLSNSSPSTTSARYRDLSQSFSTDSSSSSYSQHQSQENCVLHVSNMKVHRTSLTVSMNIKSQDRVGIQGPSGMGKSQLLRTLAGLEPLDRSSVSLFGQGAKDMAMSTWRQQVALVPQERPTLEGTPREFFDHFVVNNKNNNNDDNNNKSNNNTLRTNLLVTMRNEPRNKDIWIWSL